MNIDGIDLRVGSCIDALRAMPDSSVHCCVTSPPYFGLRDYGVEGQIGLEPTPDEFVAALVAVFREVRRVLRNDGTLWLNLGDSYCTTASYNAPRTSGGEYGRVAGVRQPRAPIPSGLKAKDLIGIPWRVAFALQADGWYLRQDIIWSKPNPMPESVRDRCTKAHEYMFMLSKGRRYFFDQDAIAEPMAESSLARLTQPTLDQQRGSDRVPGKTNGPMKAVGKAMTFKRDGSKRGIQQHGQNNGTHRPDREDTVYYGTRNKRSVWTVPTRGFKGAHFATFPPALVEPCILAGCPEGGTVLDPFGGAGTTGGVAIAHGRKAILCELNPEYAALIPARVQWVLNWHRRQRPANDNHQSKEAVA